MQLSDISILNQFSKKQKKERKNPFWNKGQSRQKNMQPFSHDLLFEDIFELVHLNGCIQLLD